MTVENRTASRDCVSQETELLSKVVYGIFFSRIWQIRETPPACSLVERQGC
jgi:hypothetical protein